MINKFYKVWIIVKILSFEVCKYVKFVKDGRLEKDRGNQVQNNDIKVQLMKSNLLI